MEYIKKNAYLKQVLRNCRLSLDKSRSAKNKKKEPKGEEKEVKKVVAKIFVANQYAEWQKFVLDLFAGSKFDEKLAIVDDWKVVIRGKTTGDTMKKSLQFGAWILVFLRFYFWLKLKFGVG